MNADRQLRVFVSSTFLDMQAERHHLVTVVFPQLRRLCEARGVTWGEVDLRWGIPDEEQAEGKVLPICLAEIQRCWPYFIGLLGERYGWIPDAVPPEVLEREPWLREQVRGKKSVTELEILHGVLREERMHGHAFFYFRDPGYLERLPAGCRRADFASENPRARAKLTRLKQSIRHARDEAVCRLRENYRDPQQLGQWVLEDLTELINTRFPDGSQPDPLAREALDHAAYARSRERVYIGRTEAFARLEAHADGQGGQPLVILGEPGAGKSALLANWAARYRQAHPEALVLEHYIGATPASADWAAMLRRILGQLKQQLGLPQEVPDRPEALRRAFPNWLHLAATKVRRSANGDQQPAGPRAGRSAAPRAARIILVLDALNQLEDRDGAPDLVWVPPVLPENVRVLVSTLPGRALDEITKRRWPVFKIEPLTGEERRALIAQYLAQYAKKLSPALVARLANAAPSANPLYLRVLLDELRLLGQHGRLGERIAYYLQAPSPYELYRKVLVRCEDDYGAGLVRDALSLLWAARRGLSESELLDALGRDGQPLPHATWSPLFLALSDALVSRSGLLSFAHEFLRTAARDAYVSTAPLQQQAHLRLAAYFGRGRTVSVPLRGGAHEVVKISVSDYFSHEELGRRRADELPWQLAAAEAWPELYELLGDGHALKAFCSTHEFDVKHYWVQLEQHSFRILDAYRLALEAPEIHPPNLLSTLSHLLNDLGHPQEALALTDRLAGLYQNDQNEEALAAALVFKADLTRARGELDASLELYGQARRVFLAKGITDGTAAALANEALVHKDQGRLDRALELQREAGRLWQELGDRTGVMHSLGNQAVIHFLRGDFQKAMALLRNQELACKELGDQDALQACVGNQAMALMEQGQLEPARLLLQQQEEICRDLGRKMSLATCLGNQAALRLAGGEDDAAMPLLEEQARLCQELDDQPGLSRALCNQGTVFRGRGEHQRALVAHQRSAQIDRAMGNLASLAVALHNEGEDYLEIGDLDMAMSLYQESEKLSRQVKSPKGIAESLVRQVILLWGFPERRDEARPLLEEADRLARQHGFHNLVGMVERVRAQTAEEPSPEEE